MTSLFIFLIFLCAVSYAQGKRYRIIIKTDPDSAKVYLNGKFRKNTPCGFSAGENFALKIAIQKQGYKTWSNTYVVQNDIILNQQLILETLGANYTTEYSLRLDSEPSDADVYINGALKGKTPYEASVPVGSLLNVQIGKEGFENWSETITVNEPVEKMVTLKTISKSKNKPWYIFSVALVGGGLITYVALQKDSGGSSTNTWPQPPARPN
jgi:hypothetical protein